MTLCIRTIEWVADQQARHKNMQSASRYARKLATSIGLYRETRWSQLARKTEPAGRQNLRQTLFVNSSRKWWQIWSRS